MKRYHIEWTEIEWTESATIAWACGVGWTDIDANSPAEARTKFVAVYGHTKRVHAFHEIRRVAPT